ncbi:MAG TPA: DoxX family protein [Thermoanaerobaculia bacterium]
MDEKLERTLTVVGRILLAAIFILSGVGKITAWSGTAGMMAAKGLPAPQVLLALAIAFEILGGLSVATGYRARTGALMLIVFLILATLIFHNFWAYQGGEREMQMAHFLKNVAILGGLLIVVARGPGRPSVAPSSFST